MKKYLSPEVEIEKFSIVPVGTTLPLESSLNTGTEYGDDGYEDEDF